MPTSSIVPAAVTPVDPSTGLPNISPAFFPAFAPTWVISSGMPPIGQGNFQFATVVVAIQRLPTVRVPPFVVGPSPVAPVNRGTFATWADVVDEIDTNGVDPNDNFTVQTSDPLPLGVWTYIGAAIAAGGTYTFNAADWTPAVAPLVLPAGDNPEPKPKRRQRKS